jgi:hypothetical protein
MSSHPNPHEHLAERVDHSIAAPANAPANFSHWEPGPDPMRAPSVAVDSGGHRWEQPNADEPWRRLPAAAETTADRRDDADEY